MHWEKYYNNFICFVHAGSSSESHFPVVALTSRKSPVFYVPPWTCHIRVSKAGLKPKFSTSMHTTLMLALRGGAGTDAQHGTAQVTPEDDALKEESQAQKHTGSDSTYTNCSKTTRSIQTENGFMVFTSVECGKRHWRPQSCPKAKPPFFSAPPRKWLEQRRSQFSVQLHYTLKRERHGWYSQGLGLLPMI